jgi:hypothetical protein
VFENRVLRRIFGPKREEVTGGWRRLYNEELHNCTFHQMLLGFDHIKEDGRYVARMGDMRNAYKHLVGKPEAKGTLGRTRRRWEDNIKDGS